MPFGAALPIGLDLCENEVAATFVVPAPNGCNLNCEYCAIRARGESQKNSDVLSVDDYLEFLHTLVSKLSVGAVTLQGHEPLLPESWTYSESLLSASSHLGIPTAIVTNGTFLSDRIFQLKALNLQGITVSLDSGENFIHDSMRGTPGAFEKTIKGIRTAVSCGMKDRINVASILHPGKSTYLDSIPELLSSLGVKQWVVSPLYGFSEDSIAGPLGDYKEIASEMERLQKLALLFSVEMIVDDEFDRISKMCRDGFVSIEGLKLKRMKKLEQILRLSPNGNFSYGKDVLMPISYNSPTWNPIYSNSKEFIDSIF